MVFIKKGEKDCKIVIPNDAHIIEKTASEELVNYIEKSLSVKLAVVPESEAHGKCIYVGHTDFAKKNGVLGKSKENWIMKTVEDSLVLTGGVNAGDRGIIYSVYHFLEDVVGVRWWNPYEEDVLSLDSLSLPDDFCREGTPYFPYRKPLMQILECDEGVKAYHHLPRTRTNVLSPLDDGISDGVYNETVRKYGAVLTMGRPHHCHVMAKYFPADEYFDEHPDWWAWNEGRGEHIRVGHYCFSNEGFFNALLERLLGYIKEDVELSEKTGVEPPYFYSLALDDLDAEFYFCQCPECKKIIEESGPSGYVIRFVNRIAREVKKIYPWAKFETLAYMIFAKPPKDDTVPDENVLIRLAYIDADMTHGFAEPANRPYLKRLKTWSELCSKKGAELQVWQYMFNLQLNYPLPLVYGLSGFMKTYREYGVKGLFIETEKISADCYDLNTFVLYHLLEDPDCDVDALVSDFTDRYYGKGGKYVKEYLEVLRDAMDRNVVLASCGCEDSPFNYIDAHAAIEGTRALDKASEAIGDEMPYRARLNWLRKTLDGVILNRYFDFKHQAESSGKKFEYDRKVLKERVVSAIEEYDKTTKETNVYAKLRKLSAEHETEYYANLPDEEENIEIPECFADTDPEDIYQFPMVGITKFADIRHRPVFGFSAVKDADAAVSTVLKVSYDDCKGPQRDFIMSPTSKSAENKRALNFRLVQDDETTEELNLYREDLVQGGYNIYKIGSLNNIRNFPDSALIALAYGFISVKIRGIAVTFPMDECDVYLSMKMSGEIYGGESGEENAIYLERLIIVRKK